MLNYIRLLDYICCFALTDLASFYFEGHIKFTLKEKIKILLFTKIAYGTLFMMAAIIRPSTIQDHILCNVS